MKHPLNILLLILTLISCKNQSNSELKPQKSEVKNIEININEKSPNSEITDYVPTELDIQKKLPEFVKNTRIPDSLKIDYDEIIFGDFNGDKKEDFASPIINLENGYFGILIIHNNPNQEYYTFGAGKEINGMTDLSWIETISKIPKGEYVMPDLVDEETGDIIGPDDSKSFKLIGEGISLGVEESHGGGILFWNEKEYIWYHYE